MSDNPYPLPEPDPGQGDPWPQPGPYPDQDHPPPLVGAMFGFPEYATIPRHLLGMYAVTAANLLLFPQ